MSLFNLFLLLLIGAITAPVTFLVHLKYKQGPVRASAGISLVAGLTCYLFSNIWDTPILDLIPMVVMGASFVGMVSFRVMNHPLLLALAGLISTSFFIAENTLFAGFGGLLGASANISILLVLGLVLTFRKAQSVNRE